MLQISKPTPSHVGLSLVVLDILGSGANHLCESLVSRENLARFQPGSEVVRLACQVGGVGLPQGKAGSREPG